MGRWRPGGRVGSAISVSLGDRMERDGFVTRTVYAEVPPRVEYALTPLGRSLEPILGAMWDWGCGYQHLVEPDRPATLPKPWKMGQEDSPASEA